MKKEMNDFLLNIFIFVLWITFLILSPFFVFFWMVTDYILWLTVDKSFLFNISWEDPSIDREVLKLSSEDKVITLCSAGDNVLDYLIENAHVTAVDLNACQIALCEIKIYAIKYLKFEDVFDIFAQSNIELLKTQYFNKLRKHMSKKSVEFWDMYVHRMRSFMYAGSSGKLAYFIFRIIFPMFNLGWIRKSIISEVSYEEFQKLRSLNNRNFKFILFLFEKVFMKSLCGLAGVPKSQLRLGLHRTNNIEVVFNKILSSDLVRDNYFFGGYILGRWTRKNCPRYLKEEYFYKLKRNIKNNKVSLFNGTLMDFLKNHMNDNLCFENNNIVLVSKDSCTRSEKHSLVKSVTHFTTSDFEEEAEEPTDFEEDLRSAGNEENQTVSGSDLFTVASLLDHMDWLDSFDINNEIALLIQNMNVEKGRVFWRSFSETLHSGTLMYLNPSKVDDRNDRVGMYFSTWVSHLKDVNYHILPRVLTYTSIGLDDRICEEKNTSIAKNYINENENFSLKDFTIEKNVSRNNDVRTSQQNHAKKCRLSSSFIKMQEGLKILLFPLKIYFKQFCFFVSNMLGLQKFNTATQTPKFIIEEFYKNQKEYYDLFREEFLCSRSLLMTLFPVLKTQKNCLEEKHSKIASGVSARNRINETDFEDERNKKIWVDVGGGTARNLEYFSREIYLKYFKKIIIVDVSASLLEVAKRRIQQLNLSDLVTCVLEDFTIANIEKSLNLKRNEVDVITMSYSFSMITNKNMALQNAKKLLKLNGQGFLCVADFFSVSEDKKLSYMLKKFRKIENLFHKWWFGHDGVFILDSKVENFLNENFEQIWIQKFRSRIPLLFFVQPMHGVIIMKTYAHT